MCCTHSAVVTFRGRSSCKSASPIGISSGNAFAKRADAAQFRAFHHWLLLCTAGTLGLAGPDRARARVGAMVGLWGAARLLARFSRDDGAAWSALEAAAPADVVGTGSGPMDSMSAIGTDSASAKSGESAESGGEVQGGAEVDRGHAYVNGDPYRDEDAI